MNVQAMLAEARALALQVMVDTCTVTRDTRGALNESTGAYAITTTTVYTGPCRVRAASSASTVDVATIGVDLTRPTLDLPWSDTLAVAEGDRVTFATGAYAGRSAVVFAEVLGTTSTSRRFTLEVQL